MLFNTFHNRQILQQTDFTTDRFYNRQIYNRQIYNRQISKTHFIH